MYRISKVLNHNTVIGIHADDNQEYLVMGKGIGFGKKVSERFEVRDGDTVYSLQATSNRGNAKELATSIQPIYLEIANEILDEAEKVFQNIDRAVLFPMAEHVGVYGSDHNFADDTGTDCGQFGNFCRN